MKVKVSVYHGPSGSGRTDLDVPFVPGETTVGQALEEAASRLAASAAKEESGTDKKEPPMVPNLHLTSLPSQVTAVTDEYIGQDWIKNRVLSTHKNHWMPNQNYLPDCECYNGILRYHVVPALVGSDEEDSSDDDDDSASKPASGSRAVSSGTGITSGCQLRMVRDWSFGKMMNASQRSAVLTSPLYEYHTREVLEVSDLTRISSIRVPIDAKGSLLRMDLSCTGKIESVFREKKGSSSMTSIEDVDIDLPENTGLGGATIGDLKAIGE